MKLNLNLKPYPNINSKSITDLTVKQTIKKKHYKMFRKKHRRKSSDLRLSKEFSDLTPPTKFIREKNETTGFHQNFKIFVVWMPLLTGWKEESKE